MDILLVSVAYLLLGLFLAGVLLLVIAICYSTLHHMRKDQIQDDKSETSWNNDHTFFDTITEFQDDFV